MPENTVSVLNGAEILDAGQGARVTLYILYCEQAATPHRAKSASPFRILAVVTAQIRKQSQDGNIKPDDCNQQPKRPIPLHILGCGAGICRLLDELEVDDQIQRSNHHHGEAEHDADRPPSEDGKIDVEKGKDEAQQIGEHDSHRRPDDNLHEHRGGPEDISLKEKEHPGKGAEGEHDGLYGDSLGLGLIHGGDPTDEEPLADRVNRGGDRSPRLLEAGDKRQDKSGNCADHSVCHAGTCITTTYRTPCIDCSHNCNEKQDGRFVDGPPHGHDS